MAVLAVAALGLAGCSSSGSDAGSTTTAATTGTGPATTTTAGTPLARYGDYQSKNYAEPSHWVCRPETTDDVCHGDLDASVITADGTVTVEKFERATDPPIDCFYMYPTISRDPTPFSDWDASADEEGYVTLQQAARLGSQCRVFAPVYRQRTLAGLAGALNGTAGAPAETGDPFADVLDAFRTYMADDNHGRGVVLIGHSQGAGMLNQLLKTEIDPHPDVRAKLVSAYLAGGSVAVPDAKVVGGDLAEIPLCTRSDQAGCVVTWSTFRSDAPPPPDALFGRPRGAPAGQVAGCVNPADPTGRRNAKTHSYFPTATASILSPVVQDPSKPTTWLDAPAGTVTTPFVSVPGLVTERCASMDGFHFLEATVHPDPSGPRADDIPGDLTPQWGLHLVDVSLVMGDIVQLVGEQAKAYAR